MKEKNNKFREIVKMRELETMGKAWKKIAGFALAICTLGSACVVGAANVNQTEDIASLGNRTWALDVQPMSDYVYLDAKITAAGTFWIQPGGYHSYRIWVDNTTNRTMTVTITSTFEPTHSFTVGSKSNKSYVVNDASYGKHKVVFSTSNNVLSGTVRVRVSETPL